MAIETEEKVIDLTDTLGKMTATLDDIKNGYTGLVGKVDGVPTKEYIEKLMKPNEPKLVTLEDSGILSSAMNFEIMNVPVGKALVGGGIAIFATELIDGFFSTSSVTTRGIIKLAGAAGTMMFLRKPLGNVGAGAVAFLLTFDALRDLTPLDTWMASLATKVTGVATTAGLADKSMRRYIGPANAPSTIHDYYAQAEGRR
jgi:hypothetical protein